jgi:hypothetical protein
MAREFRGGIVLDIENSKQIEQEMNVIAKKISDAGVLSFQINAEGVDELEEQLARARSQLEKIKKSAESAGRALPAGFRKAASNVKLLEQSLNKAHRATVKTSLASQNVIRIIQDAPFGMFGITNNLQEMSMSFSHMLKTGMSAGQAMKATFLPLISGPMALALIAALVTSLVLSWDKFAGMIDKAKISMGLLTEAQAEYNKTIRELEDPFQNVKRIIGEINLEEGDADQALANLTARLLAVKQEVTELGARVTELNEVDSVRLQLLQAEEKLLDDARLLIKAKMAGEKIDEKLEDKLAAFGFVINSDGTIKRLKLHHELVQGEVAKHLNKLKQTHDQEIGDDALLHGLDLSREAEDEIAKNYQRFIRNLHQRMREARKIGREAATEAVAVTGTQGTPRGTFSRRADSIDRQRAAIIAGSEAEIKAQIAIFDDTPENEVEIRKDIADRVVAIQEDRAARLQALNQAEMDNEEAKSQFLINTAGQTLSAIGAAFGAANEEKKGMLKAGAYMDAASAVVGIYASVMRAVEVPWFLKLPLAAAQGAAVWANLQSQIRRIDGVDTTGGSAPGFGRGFLALNAPAVQQRAQDASAGRAVATNAAAAIDRAASGADPAAGSQRIVYTDGIAAEIVDKGVRRLQREGRPLGG